MENLLKFLLEGILGKNEFEIVEKKEEGKINYIVKTSQENMGLLIGKGGRVIKSLRNILKIKATLEKISVNLSVEQ